MFQNQGIAFLVHHLAVLEHYRPVLSQLDPDTFVLLVENRPESLYGDQLVSLKVSEVNNWNTLPLSEAISSQMRWKVGVSNHGYLKGLMAKFCQIPVRFMYGVYDKQGWNFGAINSEFDVALTHGPFDSERLRRQFGLETIMMGYPKYSETRKQKTALMRSIRTHLDIEPEEKLVLWTPTLHEDSSIESFSEEFSKLRRPFRAFVKVHPMTAMQFPKQLGKLIDSGCQVWDDETFTTTELLTCADVSLHDAGGTGLAAVFVGGNPLFLRVARRLRDEIHLDSPESIIVNQLGAIEPGELVNAIERELNCERPNDARQSVLDSLKSLFFAEFNGADALIAANALRRLEKRGRIVCILKSSRYAKALRQQSHVTRIRKLLKFVGRLKSAIQV